MYNGEKPFGGKADFRTWLAGEILKSGKQHRQLCKEIGVHTTAFTEWLRHNRVPSETNCKKLAHYFNVDENKVLGLAGYYFTVDMGRDTPDRERLANLLRNTPDRLIPDLLRIARAYVNTYRAENQAGANLGVEGSTQLQ